MTYLIDSEVTKFLEELGNASNSWGHFLGHEISRNRALRDRIVSKEKNERKQSSGESVRFCIRFFETESFSINSTTFQSLLPASK